MSPWWNERICVGVGSTQVSAVRLARGWRPRVLAAHSMACPGTPNEPPWQGVTAGVRQVLAQVKVEAKSIPCLMVIGSRWVRYLLAPWQDGLSGEPEHASYAALHMQTVYGAMTQQWQVECGEAKFGVATLVCAADQSLVSHLSAAVTEAGQRLRSLRPSLSAAFSRWRQVLPKSAYWFAMIEDDRICLVNMIGGKPQALFSEQARGSVERALTAMLCRASIEVGEPVSRWPLYVFSPLSNGSDRLDLPQHRVQVLDAARYLAPARSDMRFALALG